MEISYQNDTISIKIRLLRYGGISSHKSYSNEILNEAFKGMTFRELFKMNKSLFGNYPKDEFPILYKIIDATSDLSVQVHPEDAYALKYENSLGKD